MVAQREQPISKVETAGEEQKHLHTVGEGERRGRRCKTSFWFAVVMDCVSCNGSSGNLEFASTIVLTTNHFLPSFSQSALVDVF